METIKSVKQNKTAKRVTALMLVFVLVISLFAGCKKEEKDELAQEETATEDREVAELFEDESKNDDETNAKEEDSKAQSENPSDAEELNTKKDEKQIADAKSIDSVIMNKSQAIAALNSLTAKNAKKSYSWKRVCEYTPTGYIDVGSDSFKKIINVIIGGIAKGETIDTVMGDFLGVGTLSGNVKNGQPAPQMDGNRDFLLKSMSIEESDVKQFKAQGNIYYFNLNDTITPDKNGKNAMHHMTNDFTSPKEMIDLVEGESGGLITIDREVSRSEFKSIIIKAQIVNGELLSVEFSYKMAANPVALNAKGITIKGKGEVKVTQSYSNFR